MFFPARSFCDGFLAFWQFFGLDAALVILGLAFLGLVWCIAHLPNLRPFRRIWQLCENCILRLDEICRGARSALPCSSQIGHWLKEAFRAIGIVLSALAIIAILAFIPLEVLARYFNAKAICGMLVGGACLGLIPALILAYLCRGKGKLKAFGVCCLTVAGSAYLGLYIVVMPIVMASD